MSNRRFDQGFFLGTVQRVVAVTSPFQRSALQQLALGINPLNGLSDFVREEIELFIRTLDSHGFLNSRHAQLSAPQRFAGTAGESDIAAHHMRARTAPELAQSEWIDSASDGGTSTLIARSLYPVVLSGRSRVITLLYSILLASGVTRLRFADRHLRPVIDSMDMGFGNISHNEMGLHYYDFLESTRRGHSLFPVNPSDRHDTDSSKPLLLIHYGDCDPEEVVQWSQERIPHFLIHQPIGDEIAIGPMVVPDETPCIRCLSLYEIDNFGYTRLERIPLTAVDELPAVTAHYVAAVAASKILHFIDRMSDSTSQKVARNTGIGEVTYLNFQNLTEPQVVAIARHPLCGCDYAAIT